MKISRLFLFLFLSTISGMLFFAFYHHWIIFQFPWQNCSFETVATTPAQKKIVTLSYWQTHRFITEKKEILWSDNLTMNLTSLIKSWLHLAHEENCIPKKITLQSLIINETNQEAFISCNHNLINKELSSFEQLMVIEGLLKTVRDNSIPIRSIRFLVHHKPMQEYHLDFATSWPVEGFLQRTPKKLVAPPAQKLLTIMIDPAGDAQHTGRVIDGTFERGLTLQYAQELKKQLEYELPNTTIILTRFPGEVIEPFQNATFANRLGVSLYLNIHFYYEPTHPRIHLFYAMQHPETDFWKKQSLELAFIPYHQAHLKYLSHTAFYAQQLAHNLTTENPIGLPFKPLTGIQAPALALEIGLRNKDDWQKHIEPMVKALTSLKHTCYR